MLNIVACFLLSRLLKEWFGLHEIISLFGANYCISTMTGYILRQQLRDRLKKKEPNERIYLDRLSFQSSSDTNDRRKFEQHWQLLIDDDRENRLSAIIDVPLQNRWLFFVTIILINYQLDSTTWSYVRALFRTIGLMIVLISGSAIRYQTLFEREREKHRERFERWIVYSQDVFPVVSIEVQRIDRGDEFVFLVQSFHINSKFRDYFYDLACYTCQNLIDWTKQSGMTNEKSIRLMWPLTSCEKIWIYALNSKGFVSQRTYRDFSFMPMVHSYVQEYYYEQSLSNINEESRKDQ